MASVHQHLLSLIPTSKRSACDRCRKHKVACPPRSDTALDCARCVRLGAACVTGYSKPLGKPTLHHQSVASCEATPSTTTTTTTSSPSRGSLPPSSHDFGDPPGMAEPMETWSLPEQAEEGGDLISGPWEHWATLPMSSDGLQTWASDTTSAPSLEMLQHWGPTPPIEQNMLPSQHQQHFSAPPSGRIQHSSSPGQNPGPLTCDARKDLDAAEYNLRLSQLRVNLARQMMYRASSSWDHQSSMNDEAEIADESQRDIFPSHALGEALCSTSELLDLVRSYQRLGGSSRPYGDATDLLDLLVSYLHLVAVFNCLLQQLYDALRNGGSPVQQQNSAMPYLHPLPNLHLSGFAVSEGKLQTRILLQATQHQFKQIERALGIPPEYAVSLHARDPNNYNGAQGEHVQALFQVIFSEEQSNDGIMVSASAVSTLRNNITMLDQLLDESEN